MEQPKTLIIITAYNRAESLWHIVDQLLAESSADFVVFDDKSDKPLTICSPRVTQITNPEHRGKAGFWQTYNDIFAYCKEHEYDYYIILPDDVEPCPDFVSKAIEAYDKAGCICLSPLLTNRSLLPGISRWGMKPIVLRDWGYETAYFDCCTICRRDFFEALDWRLEPIQPSGNPFRSSGVGRQITTRLQAAEKKMGHVKRTLLAMTDTHESVMNVEERKRHPMWCDWRDNKPCVDVHMASLWRDGHVLKTAESLFKQPELDTLYVTLNNYTTEQSATVSRGLSRLASEYGKHVVLRRAKNKKGSNEKLAQLPKSKAKYIAFADDDIVYTPDYLLRLIGGCNARGCAVSLHGAVLKRFPIRKYYNGDRQMYSCNVSVAEDTKVDLIGSGVALIRREWFTPEELKALYADAPAVSMDDIILSCALAQKGISRWVLEHPSGVIRLKEHKESDGYVYDQYKDNDSAQVEYVNSHFKR